MKLKVKDLAIKIALLVKKGNEKELEFWMDQLELGKYQLKDISIICEMAIAIAIKYGRAKLAEKLMQHKNFKLTDDIVAREKDSKVKQYIYENYSFSENGNGAGSEM